MADETYNIWDIKQDPNTKDYWFVNAQKQWEQLVTDPGVTITGEEAKKAVAWRQQQTATEQASKYTKADTFAALKAAGGIALPLAGQVGGAALGMLTGPAAPLAVPSLEMLGGVAGEYLAQKTGLSPESKLQLALQAVIPGGGRLLSAAKNTPLGLRRATAAARGGLEKYLPESTVTGTSPYAKVGALPLDESALVRLQAQSQIIPAESIPLGASKLKAAPEINIKEANLLREQASISQATANISKAQKAQLASAKAELATAQAELAAASQSDLAGVQARVLRAKAAVSRAEEGMLRGEIQASETAKAAAQDIKSDIKRGDLVGAGMTFEEADAAVKALGAEASKRSGSEGQKLFELRKHLVDEIDKVNEGYKAAAKTYHRQESVSRLQSEIQKSTDPAKTFKDLRSERQIVGVNKRVIREGQDITMKAFSTKELDEIQKTLELLPKGFKWQTLMEARIVSGAVAGSVVGGQRGGVSGYGEGAAAGILTMLFVPYGRR